MYRDNTWFSTIRKADGGYSSRCVMGRVPLKNREAEN
jgi:hypothetical protein